MSTSAYDPSEGIGFVRLRTVLGCAVNGVEFIARHHKLIMAGFTVGAFVLSQLASKGNAVSLQSAPSPVVSSAEVVPPLADILGRKNEQVISIPAVVPEQIAQVLPQVVQVPQPLPQEVKDIIPESPYPTVNLKNVKLRPLSDQEKVIAADLIFEAGGEKKAIRGMQGIANVIQNRSRYAGVPLYNPVAVPRHFSCFDDVTTSVLPGFLDKVDLASRHPQWENAQKLVILAVKNKLPDITDGATHYSNPKHSAGYKWEKQLKDALIIGEHVFGKTAISKKQCGLGLSRALIEAASLRPGQVRKGPREVSR